MSYIHSAGFTSLVVSLFKHPRAFQNHTPKPPLSSIHISTFSVSMAHCSLSGWLMEHDQLQDGRVKKYIPPLSQQAKVIQLSGIPFQRGRRKWNHRFIFFAGVLKSRQGCIYLSLSLPYYSAYSFFLFFERRRWSQRGYPDHSVTFPSGSSSWQNAQAIRTILETTGQKKLKK